MPFEVTFNAQFDKFVKFADDAVAVGKGKTIAKLGGEDPLAGRTIATQTDDKVGAFIRKGSTKKQNDAVRDLFKQSIIDMFGGASKIPQSVKDAMLLSDYGKGKPLTARRIMAVKEQVVIALRDLEGCTGRAISEAANAGLFEGINDEEKERRIELIKTAVKHCFNDKDAFEIVATHLPRIIIGGDGNLRSAEGIKKKVDEIIANFDEIRTLAKKNPAVMSAGRMFMEGLGGKSVAPGVIGRIVSSASKVKIGDIKKLSPSSTGYGMHKAIVQFQTGVQQVMISSDAERTLEGAEELEPCRNFVADLIMAKCGQSAVKNIQATFATEKMAKLKKLYYLFSQGNFTPASPISKGVELATRTHADMYIKFLDALKFSADVHCGVAPKDTKPAAQFKERFDYDELQPGKVLSQIIDAARINLLEERQQFLEKVVKGDGHSAEVLRNIYSACIGAEPYKPKDSLDFVNDTITQSMINQNICSECKLFATGKAKQTIFARDLVRSGITVNLPGGRQLSRDYDKACDELAQLITQKPQAKYSELDAKTRNKVHITMSFLSQEGAKAAFSGHGTALDPKRQLEAFLTASDQHRDIRAFTLEISPDGGLTVAFEGRMHLEKIIKISPPSETVDTKPGSTLDVGYTFRIKAGEFERLAKLDFSKCDDSEAARIMDADVVNRTEVAAKALPKDFQFTETGIFCHVTYSATIN